MDLNLMNLKGSPLKPIRSCLKNTGPFEVSLMSAAITRKRGENRKMSEMLPMMSIVRFAMTDCRLSAPELKGEG
jgi:hypothetical protein